MGKVRKKIEVDVPISVAYNQWTQFESFPQFMSGVDEVTQHGDTTVRWRVSIGGVTRVFEAEITEQHPDERIAWRSTDGKVHAGVVSFHRLSASSTRITLEMEWYPEGFVEKAGEVLNIDSTQVGRDLGEFKRMIESNGFATGAWRGEVPRNPEALGL